MIVNLEGDFTPIRIFFQVYQSKNRQKKVLTCTPHHHKNVACAVHFALKTTKCSDTARDDPLAPPIYSNITKSTIARIEEGKKRPKMEEEKKGQR